MSNPADPLDTRVAELGHRVARLLAADVRTFLPQVVRERFADSPDLADAMDDAALAALKRDTLEAAEALAQAVERRLAPAAAWLSAKPAPREGAAPPPLTEHVPVAEVVSQIERSTAEFLAGRGLPAEPPVVYRLPMRFIDGDNLATLTMNFWKAVQRRHDQRQKSDAAQAAASLGERRRRWDDA